MRERQCIAVLSLASRISYPASIPKGQKVVFEQNLRKKTRNSTFVVRNTGPSQKMIYNIVDIFQLSMFYCMP